MTQIIADGEARSSHLSSPISSHLRKSASSADNSPLGFDFTAALRRLCEDLAARLPELAHIDLNRVIFRYCQSRGGRHGVVASCTPLRFAGGSLYLTRRGRRWMARRIVDAAGREMLYVLSFYLPRFMNYPLDEKLATVIHELWHISPAFDGDLRRHPGRCYAHSGSEKEYHARMHELAREWLALDPPAELFDFLRLSFAELARKHGGVCGTRMRLPSLLAVPAADD